MTSRQSVLRTRSRILQAIRHFFVERDFVEVETPVRLPVPALETHIDAIPCDGQHLRTSPEIHMKRLLAAGEPRIFQMGPCFRRGETGRFHNPEFTMLEWYRVDADYLDILVDMKALLGFVAGEVTGATTVHFHGNRIALLPVWDRLTVEEAFVMYAGWNPVTAYDPDRFDIDLVEKVEPRLAADKPTVIMDYPAAAGALARRKPGRPDVAERWEVYAGGMELANAFSELTDADEQRRRFGIAAAERRSLGSEVYPIDERFLKVLEAGMPAAGGVALGVDRLVMLLTDASSIEDVRPFCREA
jgi:elongation factor P--(R)-beta-lysine ligase